MPYDTSGWEHTPMITDALHVMTFGKYKGKTVGEIFDENPSYLWWCQENVDSFELSESMLTELKQHLVELAKYKPKYPYKPVIKFSPVVDKADDDDLPF